VKPFSVLELDIPALFIHGNGDREVLARMSGVETTGTAQHPARLHDRSVVPGAHGWGMIPAG
jgi:hypothetical protein